MKVLEREKLKIKDAKENLLYVFLKSKNAWLGYFENGDFFALKSNNSGVVSKIQSNQISLLFETEYTNQQGSLAYEKYTKSWLTDFTENLVSKRVVYTGAILSEESHHLLYEKMKHLIPKEWNVLAHHMTLKLGELDENNIDLLGSENTLNVIGYSLSLEKGVMAVKVETDLETKSTYKHVTVAVSNNSSAVASNELVDFVDFEMEKLNVVVSYFLNNKKVITKLKDLI